MGGRSFGESKNSGNKGTEDSSEREREWQEHVAKGNILSIGIYHSLTSWSDCCPWKCCLMVTYESELMSWWLLQALSIMRMLYLHLSVKRCFKILVKEKYLKLNNVMCNYHIWIKLLRWNIHEVWIFFLFYIFGLLPFFNCNSS